MIIAMVFFMRQLQRELTLICRQIKTVLFVVLFFGMVIIFFPLTLTPTPEMLQKILPGLLWTAMLLSMLLASENFFQRDYVEGVIEQWLVSGVSLEVLIVAKISAHWLLTTLSIALLCPIIGLLFNLNIYQIIMTIVLLAISTPCIIFLCALAAAFCIGISQQGAIVALILLPLSLPIMIFGSGGLNSLLIGDSISAELAMLAAISLLAITLLPYAIAAVIRIGCAD